MLQSTHFLNGLWAPAAAAIALQTVSLPAMAQPYEAYFDYIGDYPDLAFPGFADGVTGIANDGLAWYVTTTDSLWRIPGTVDLATVTVNSPDVLVFHKAGDLDIGADVVFGDPFIYTPPPYHLDPDTYVIVPNRSEVDFITYLVVFRTFDLSLVGQYFDMAQNGPFLPHRAQVDGMMWNFGPPDFFHCIAQFRLYDTYFHLGDFVTYFNSEDFLGLCHAIVPDVNLNCDEGCLCGAAGEFGTQTAYGVVQAHDCLGEPPTPRLYAVDMSGDPIDALAEYPEYDLTWLLLRESAPGDSLFDFSYPLGEEPVSLTLWDLDEGVAPGMDGQLHVLVKGELFGTPYIRMLHYAGTIYVDGDNSRTETGRAADPYDTMQEAVDKAWDGAQIIVNPGNYSETLTISKNVKITAPLGAVTIGG